MSKELPLKPLPELKNEPVLTRMGCLIINDVNLIILLYFISPMKNEPIKILDNFR